jgi:CheY-like chemotaxis protein
MLIDTASKMVHILLAEDNPIDVMMTREAMEHYKILNPRQVVEVGVAAMAYLRREGDYASSPRPGLILLDLNLPAKSGREMLQEIKADPELLKIPVVILTTSNLEEDGVKSYGLHANSYITKPADFDKFSDIVRTINHFWFGVVTLPRADL